MGNMGMADSEYHEKMMRLGQQRDAVPARRPVDDALDRLEALSGPADSIRGQALAAVRSELQRLREELRVITNERDELYEANWPWEWVIATREKERRQAAEAEADKYRKATDQQARRAEAAEAELERLTKGLRERDELLARILDHGAAGYAEHQARRSAWISRSASPSDERLHQFEAAIGRPATNLEREMLSPSDGKPVPIESLLDDEDYEVMREGGGGAK